MNTDECLSSRPERTWARLSARVAGGLVWALLSASVASGSAAATPGDAAAKGPVRVAGDQASDLGPRDPGPPAPPSTFPRLSNGRPDFTGLWFAGVKDLVSLDDGDGHVDIPLTPDYRAVFAKRVQATAAGKPKPDFVSTCQAFGMPRIMSYGTLEFVARPKELWMITEVLHEVRRIYLDGRAHGRFDDASFDGVSQGHWDGDTLVVDTTKLRAGYLDMAGAPHSDQMKIEERIRMINKNGIEDLMTISDPVALTRPWTIKLYFTRQPADYEISEYICAENLRSGIGSTSDPDSNPNNLLPRSAVTP